MTWPLMWRMTHVAALEGADVAANATIALLRERVASAVISVAEERERTANAQETARELAQRYDTELADKNEQIATLREQKAVAAVTIAELQRERDSLRVALKAAEQARPKGRSKLTQAIRDNARMPDGSIDRRLVNHFRSQANLLSRRGMKEDEVIESLSQWQTTENANQMTADRMADAFESETV